MYVLCIYLKLLIFGRQTCVVKSITYEELFWKKHPQFLLTLVQHTSVIKENI